MSLIVMLMLLGGFSTAVYIAFSKQGDYHRIENATDETYRMSNRLLSQLKDAETGQRGFLLTGDDRYLQPFLTAEVQVPETLKTLHSHEADDPVLAEQLARYEVLVAEKFAELRKTIELYRTVGHDAALEVVKTDRGQGYMEAARSLTLEISDKQREALDKTRAREDLLDRRIKSLILFGGPAIAILAFIGFMIATRRIVTAVRRLEVGVSQIGSSKGVVTLDIPGKDEFSRLASSFNGMAARLSAARFAQDRAESMLRENNENLTIRGHELENRTRTLDLLGRIAHRLPGCSNEAEFGELLERYVPQIFPGTPGALFLLNPSHTLLRRLAVWNDPKACSEEFDPGDCWSLRRGQQHINNDFGQEVVCRHIDPEKTRGYMCWPLVAQNETVGLLYVEQGEEGIFIVDERSLQDVNVLCETIALALVNLRLRQTLRDQSIRDALTGLFNRRYLEESLELEFSRAERGGHSIAIIMIDVDHFKRFNDTFGHAAGDAVLKKVGETIDRSIRKGDVACRYGGEEFILVLIGASIEAARFRAEQVRTAVKALSLDHNGHSLGTLTVSLGVALYPQNGANAATVIAEADTALYLAKRNGRDQVQEAPGHAAVASDGPDAGKPREVRAQNARGA